MLNATVHIEQIDTLIKGAMRAVDEDSGASAVLHAVVKEFSRKSNKALQALADPEDSDLWTHVVELEQAGDSAKIAADADTGVKPHTRRQVRDAHDAICRLKTEMMEQSRRHAS